MTSDGVRLSALVSSAFTEVHRAIKSHEATHIWLAGGRGSTKSTFASIELILLLVSHPDANVVVLRKVGKTLRKSVYAQVLWSIGKLGLSHLFHATTSPMEITYKPTGQKIIFEGLDAPEKIKSLKFVDGYAAVVWFEEIDQFGGMEEVRNVLQSLMRGGERYWILYSFNPPRSRDNWVNKEILKPHPDRIVHESTYLDVPEQWLGEQFIVEAEQLRELDEQSYRHEYLGEPVGTGGSVFENITLREITDQEIESFDRTYSGVDWGWFPDPWVWVRCAYQSAQRILYIFDERSGLKLANETSAALVLEALGGVRETVTCDAAEPKSVDNYRALGVDARRAIKGPGSVDHGMKWLSSRVEIVIDPKRAPRAAEEFTAYEFERARDGEFMSGYPDENNHAIDAVRYALERVSTRRANV